MEPPDIFLLLSECDSDRKGDKETWVEWMIRTTQVASDTMRKAKVPDWVEEQRCRKWRWAGHIVRRDDMRWTYRMRGWEPFSRGSRPVGRPAARCEDTLNRFASMHGIKWTEMAKDRNQWKSLEDDFVRFEI